MVLLSVVVPTFNEADHIVEFLAGLGDHLRHLDYEILTVDDNSPDDTHARIVGHAKKNPRVRPILRTKEKGLATAVIEGMRQSRGTYVAVMDSDFQHPARDVPRLLEAAQRERADCVIASRYAVGGSQEGFPRARRIVSWGAKVLALLALPEVRRFRVRDPQSGFFLVRRQAIPVERLRPRGYKILLDILVRSRLERVVEVGYRFENRRGGQSKLGLRTQVDYVRHLAALAFVDRENRRMAKFLLVGASGTIVNLAILALFVEYAGWGPAWREPWSSPALLLGALAPLVAREVSILWNFVWNDRLTFRHDRPHAAARFFGRMFRFHVISVWSALAYLAIYYPMTYVGVHYLLAAGAGILVGFLINYVGNVRWTYARRRETHGHP